MEFLNLKITPKNIPVIDKSYIPLGMFFTEYLKKAKEPFAIALERSGGLVSIYDTAVHGTADMYEADCYYAERLAKILLWARGGYKIYVCGNKKVADYLKNIYSDGGLRAFDSKFMARVYEREFEVVHVDYSEKPVEKESSMPVGRHLDGCRIGFDAGGSDLKVSAVIDGESVFSKEIVWHPKINSDPDYHFKGIVDALKTAAAKMPRVDAIGVSSAGIYIGGRTMVASLFIKVPEDDFNKKIKDIYPRAAAEIGDVPIEVANDGDVTALAGAMSLSDTNVLGIAMGTSQAGGFVDKNGNITGWLNELAFVPVDANPNAMADEWSDDIGCGVKYFSQDGVIKLAGMAGIKLDDSLPPGERLLEVQKLMESKDARAADIFNDIGIYFGHSAVIYSMFYDIKHILLLGRVMSGEGGNIIYSAANKVLSEEYPELAKKITLHLPDEKIRRVGQSVAAASLPALRVK